MHDIKKIINYLFDPDYRFIHNVRHGKYRNMDDEKYLTRYYHAMMGMKLNLKNPQTFNEKLQWLKIHDRKPIYTTMVDKYEAKSYVGNIIGYKYIIPTLGVWDHFDDIDFNTLPDQFVLKTTHDSGGVVIVKDKNSLNKEIAKNKLELSLANNFYYVGREWPYKNVKPRIIAEQYMCDNPEDSSSNELKDFKFFCFGGQAKCFKVDFDRFIDHHANYYDAEGNLLDFGEAALPPKKNKQINLDMNVIHKMETLGEQLSKGSPFLRTDFYDVNGKIYFGELTLYPASGFGAFTSQEADELLGKWIELPESDDQNKKNSFFFVNDKVIAIFCPKTKDEREELTDYKIYCFNGKVDTILVCVDRNKGDLKFYYFDKEWNLLPFNKKKENPLLVFRYPRPKNFDKMIYIAEKLSKNMPFVRVDLYDINGQIYFGELTLYSGSGFDFTLNMNAEMHFGNLLDLSKVTNEK